MSRITQAEIDGARIVIAKVRKIISNLKGTKVFYLKNRTELYEVAQGYIFDIHTLFTLSETKYSNRLLVPICVTEVFIDKESANKRRNELLEEAKNK